MTAAPLKVVSVSGMPEHERGGSAVVVLHGWGAEGTDLVPLAKALKRPGVRFFVPAAPLPEVGGGRAWWHLDGDRPVHAYDDQPPAGHQPHAQVAASRELVLALVTRIRQQFQPGRLVVAGFSQGAMLSLDVALAARPPVDQVAMLSGVILADTLPALHAEGSPRPTVLVTHGRSDPQLPFAGGDRAREILQRHGFPVTWLPFKGGHEIPTPVLESLRAFLADA